MVVDPNCGGSTSFESRLALLCARLVDAGQDRLPGARRFMNRAAAEEFGIPIALGELQRLRKLAAKVRET